jgi:hypothetical protein
VCIEVESGVLKTSVNLRDGCLVYNLHELTDGDEEAVEVFVEDYLIGSDAVRWDSADDVFQAIVSLGDLPPVSFPAVLRSKLQKKGIELPVIAIDSLKDLLQSNARVKGSIEIVGIQSNVLRCETTIAALPRFAREFSLFVNSTPNGTALSEPGEKGAGRPVSRHKINFGLKNMLRDGDHIEIIENETGSVSFSETLTWMNLVGGLVGELKLLDNKLEKALSQVEELSVRLNVLANISNERLLMDRLDLYYYLLNERIEREVRAIQQPSGVVVSEEAIADPGATENTRLSASALEGVGCYDVETGPASEWRWFGPRVTLMFKDVPPAARELKLAFSQFAAGVDPSLTTSSVDGVEIEPSVVGHGGGCEMTLPLYHRTARPDRAVIVHLNFAGGSSSKADPRVLSAAFVSAEIVVA